VKLGELKKIFEAAADIYRAAGNEAVAEALQEVSRVCEGRTSTTVAAFAKLVVDRGPLTDRVEGA
jgi:hypothetical protein